jgi:hypothetical protein
MAKLLTSPIIFIYLVLISFALGRERDVWSIGNVELKPEVSPLPDIKFSFWRKLHPDCAKSKINTNGCMIPEDQKISNKTCFGPLANNNEWTICPGVRNVEKGSVRWRLKKNSYQYLDRSHTKLTIEMVRKEEIHEYVANPWRVLRQMLITL